MLELRDYQLDALYAVERAFAEGKRRVLLVLPTSAGKTIVFCALIARRGGRALILVHRDELVSQAIDKLTVVDPTLHVGVVKSECDEVDAQVVVASIQTVSQPHRLQRLASNFTTVVVDEAHHGLARTWLSTLTHVGAFREDGPAVLGVTATPDRGDKRGLIEVFETIAYERPMLEMIKQGWLADIKATVVQLQVDLDTIKTGMSEYGKDFSEGELETKLLRANAPEYIVQAYQQHAPGRRAICFCPGVESAHQTAQEFQRRGIPAESLDGGTPIDKRRAMLARLRAGTTRVITNCNVLTEGFDEPAVDCIIVARPTQSRPFYVQMIGRGTRTAPGKDFCQVIDVTGVSKKHDLQTISTLFGVTPKTGETVGEAHTRETVEREVAVKAAEFDAEARRQLIAERVEVFKKTVYHWIGNPGGSLFILPLGLDGKIQLEHQTAGWSVVHVDRSQQRRVIASKLPIDYATSVGIDTAKKITNGSLKLAKPGASWRSEPTTDAQRSKLGALRYRGPVPETKGAASDLIVLLETQEAARPRASMKPSAKQAYVIRRAGFAVPETASEAQRLVGQIKAGAR